jgi:hypothetical protein
VAEQRLDRVERHATVDRLGREHVTQLGAVMWPMPASLRSGRARPRP